MTKLDAILRLVDMHGEACFHCGDWRTNPDERSSKDAAALPFGDLVRIQAKVHTTLIAALREALGEGESK